METEKTQLYVSGMHCTSCAIGVHKMLENKGLHEIKVDYLNDEVVFLNKSNLPLSNIVKDIESMGYQVSSDFLQDQPVVWYQNIESLFAVCVFFTIPLLAHMFWSLPILHNAWFQLFLCVPIFIIGTFYFGKSAFYSLKLGLPNMDVLIYMGALAAFVYSLIGTLQNLGHQYMFYETTATIITLVFLGNIFEKRAVKQTTSAMQDLLKLQKSVAHVMVGDEIKVIPSEEVKVGDRVLVKEGDNIPVDGKILKGEGAADESMLSGESIPVDKILNTVVFAGSVLVKGNLEIESTKTYQNTALAQIIRLVKNAQDDKPHIQKLGDKVAGIFVPVIICISLLTFVLSFFVFGIAFKIALMSAIAVLVISCPCAMGLATPTAVMVGLGRATKMGILVKGAQTIEELAQIKTVVFDKTGTLTTGNFVIENWEWFVDGVKEECENIVYALEQYSNHPIAKSLLTQLASSKREKIYLKNVNELKGLGIEAEDFQGNTYRIGSGKLFNLHLKTSLSDLYVFKNDVLMAGIKIVDELKPKVVETLAQLKQLGIESVLLSGDKTEKCLFLANEIGISKVYAEKMPQEKLEIIQQLMKSGKTAMVGDGINDGPALSTAHIGISLSGASDIAVQASQVVLMNNGDISVLPKAVALAQKTYQTIKQNLFWAFAYNIVAVPMAAMGMLSPMLGVFAMACSDVVVIGNSLLLKIKKLALR